jgi:nitroreductase
MIEELINKNRSYRRFYQEHEVSKEQLLKLADFARLSPSPRNLQALKFWLSNNEQLNEQIFPNLAWAGYLKNWAGPKKGERPAAYIFIAGDKSFSPDFQKDFLPTASGIVAQSVLLGAVEMGLGGCIIAAFQKNKLAEIISLPDNLEIMLVLAIGKPKEMIILDELNNESDIKYWRDEKEAHHVPKRRLEDISKML